MQSFGVLRHRVEVISILKQYLSENIFIQRRSAPFSPALKSKGLLDE
jgi:hypothetical protein